MEKIMDDLKYKTILHMKITSGMAINKHSYNMSNGYLQGFFYYFALNHTNGITSGMTITKHAIINYLEIQLEICVALK
jgi:hypothetical protein